MKTIGLIGGMRWESSAEYYRIINQETKRVLGGQHNAKSVMVTVDFFEIEELQRRSEWQKLGQLMVHAAIQLQDGGADFIVLCTNTMHKLAPEIEASAAIPLLHIADATARKICAAGHKKVGLLGTRFTMEEEFYRGRLEKNFGINVMVPSKNEREDVHCIIYDELCHGKIRDTSRTRYQEIIDNLRKSAAEAVILGCTEITLLIKPEHSGLPVFDTTTMHALSAVEAAMEG
jgi:aspartate racemase